MWNQYTYDRYDRKTSTRYASGKVDSCAHGALTDTLTENGIRHIQQYSADGLMTNATDEGGNIAYFYRADGQPLVIVASDSVQTSFYYDAYGRRNAINHLLFFTVRKTLHRTTGLQKRYLDWSVSGRRNLCVQLQRRGQTRTAHPDCHRGIRQKV